MSQLSLDHHAARPRPCRLCLTVLLPPAPVPYSYDMGLIGGALLGIQSDLRIHNSMVLVRRAAVGNSPYCTIVSKAPARQSFVLEHSRHQ